MGQSVKLVLPIIYAIFFEGGVGGGSEGVLSKGLFPKSKNMMMPITKHKQGGEDEEGVAGGEAEKQNCD